MIKLISFGDLSWVQWDFWYAWDVMSILFKSDDQTDFFSRFALGLVGLLERMGRRVRRKTEERLAGTGAAVGFAGGSTAGSGRDSGVGGGVGSALGLGVGGVVGLGVGGVVGLALGAGVGGALG